MVHKDLSKVDLLQLSFRRAKHNLSSLDQEELRIFVSTVETLNELLVEKGYFHINIRQIKNSSSKLDNNRVKNLL